MIEELIKEKRIERDLEETNKIMSAIHEQAYWNRKDKEEKEMVKKLDKELKNNKIKEVLHSELETALLLIISLAGLTAWGLVFLIK